MSDDDSLYFSFDDQEEPEEEDQAQAEEGQNKSFLYGIIALGAVFLLTLCLGVGYLAFRPQIEQMIGGQVGQVSGNQATNEFNMTAYAMTQQVDFLTQSAPTEPLEPIVSPTTLASSTPTSGVELTVIGTATVEGTLEGTQQEVAEITPGDTQAPTTPGAGTQIAQVTPGTASPVTPTAGVSGLVTPTGIMLTSSIIEVTPLGGGATPTRIVSSLGGTVTPGGTPVATGVGGPIQPTVQSTLPSTGFAGSAGLLGAGFLAIVLVAVVVVVRRIRLQ
jgi:hypothetical protein